jgi:hypothetical protein
MYTTRYSCRIFIKLNVVNKFFEKKKRSQISNFIKIRPVGAELFYAERQTDMTVLIVAPKKVSNAFCAINITNTGMVGKQGYGLTEIL